MFTHACMHARVSGIWQMQVMKGISLTDIVTYLHELLMRMRMPSKVSSVAGITFSSGA